MEPIPYRVREQDIDEVLSAYEAAGGGTWNAEERAEARAHVMRNVLDIDEVVATTPEDQRGSQNTELRVQAVADELANSDSVRREAALAAIEDLLIRDGFITLSDREKRVFPIVTVHDDEHEDG
ncbi:MAG: hypothetical protein ACREMA_13995 [Longimicrobiales bacterium]